MLWLKAFHLIFMVTWFAGLFYLPRLFVYHAMTDDQIGLDRFKVMEAKLYFGIMTPSMILTFVFGIWMLEDYAWTLYSGAIWLHIKLILLLFLLAYHILCAKYLLDFKNDRNRHTHIYFRWFNEIPVVFLLAIIFLAVIKPI